jgi:hypothetical protein
MLSGLSEYINTVDGQVAAEQLMEIHCSLIQVEQVAVSISESSKSHKMGSCPERVLS